MVWIIIFYSYWDFEINLFISLWKHFYLLASFLPRMVTETPRPDTPSFQAPSKTILQHMIKWIPNHSKFT